MYMDDNDEELSFDISNMIRVMGDGSLVTKEELCIDAGQMVSCNQTYAQSGFCLNLLSGKHIVSSLF